MNNLVINLRGTSGSGKTTIVAGVLARCGLLRPKYGMLGPKRPEAVQVQGPTRLLTVLGPYPENGGDAIVSGSGVNGVVELIHKYREQGDVLFEALIISSMYGLVGRWLCNNPPTIVAVLDVTIDECRAGLTARQKQPKEAKTQLSHLKGTLKVAQQLEDDGVRVEYVKRESAVGAILEWLKS